MPSLNASAKREATRDEDVASASELTEVLSVLRTNPQWAELLSHVGSRSELGSGSGKTCNYKPVFKKTARQNRNRFSTKPVFTKPKPVLVNRTGCTGFKFFQRTGFLPVLKLGKTGLLKKPVKTDFFFFFCRKPLKTGFDRF